ncbi:MAG: hypothetical protein HDKAJFGB_03649 [Anaerolineae bacterium]|nr:hypothetical protein [Anaerolineae bacterium]
MPLKPENEKHAAQIAAGTLGRRKGHGFEKALSNDLNNLAISNELFKPSQGHLKVGNPAFELARYILAKAKITRVNGIRAYWLGGLATSGEGDPFVSTERHFVGKSKSDVVVEIETPRHKFVTGVSVKTCNKPTPTNSQLFFTTASAFCRLLRDNGVPVSDGAEKALRMFCGDAGFRPVDKNPNIFSVRKSDPDRWFFEELPAKGRKEWEMILGKYQREVTTVLLQKAYAGDPLLPEFLLHQTVSYSDINKCEMALFTIGELVDLSCRYTGFETSQYLVRKGRFKGDPNPHLAPRFGYIQFQRGGQKQHPTQLQFNLQSGYFYKLPSD